MSSKFKELMAQARNRHEELSQEGEAEARAASGGEEPATRAAAGDAASPVPQDGVRQSPQSSAAAQEREQPEGATKRRGRPRGKRSHPDFEQVSAYISRRTHLEVKVALLQEGQGREFSELVEQLLGRWLQEGGSGSAQ